MKTLRLLSAFTLITILLASCSTSNDVVGGVFQKRKYSKGYYWNRGGVKKSVDSEKESDLAVVRNTEEIRMLDRRNVNSIQSGDKKIVPIRENAIDEKSTGNSESKIIDRAAERNLTKPAQNQSLTSTEEKTVIREKKEKTISQILEKKQKSESGRGDDSIFILSVILAIFIPPLGVLLYTNIDWTKVIICLILTLLFFLPGMIYALLVVFDVL